MGGGKGFGGSKGAGGLDVGIGSLLGLPAPQSGPGSFLQGSAAQSGGLPQRANILADILGTALLGSPSSSQQSPGNAGGPPVRPIGEVSLPGGDATTQPIIRPGDSTPGQPSRPTSISIPSSATNVIDTAKFIGQRMGGAK